MAFVLNITKSIVFEIICMQNNKDGFQYFIPAFSQFEYTPTLIQYPSQRL